MCSPLTPNPSRVGEPTAVGQGTEFEGSRSAQPPESYATAAAKRLGVFRPAFGNFTTTTRASGAAL